MTLANQDIRAAFDTHQHCSLFSRVSGDDPIGSARMAKHHLFIEAGLPWDHEYAKTSSLPQGFAEAFAEIEKAGHDVKVQGMVPDAEYSRPGYTHVLRFTRPEGLFATHHKDDYHLPSGEVPALLRTLFLEPAGVDRFDAYRHPSEEVRELFVCTHGARDACCGTFGYPVFKRVRDEYAAPSGGALRVWRTSHTGGHRFAPTMLDFPEGRYWGHLDPDILDSIIRHTGDVTRLFSKYRGWSALGLLEQVTEREVLMREGWKWTGYRVSAESWADGVHYTTPVWQGKSSGGEVRIQFASLDGADKGVYEATVVQEGEAPFGGCGKELAMEKQFRVTRLERRSAP